MSGENPRPDLCDECGRHKATHFCVKCQLSLCAFHKECPECNESGVLAAYPEGHDHEFHGVRLRPPEEKPC